MDAATEDITKLKAHARNRALAARKAAHAQRQDAADSARDVFLTSGLRHGARVIAGYRPIRTELDPTPLMIALHRAGHRLVVPVIEAAGAPLAFHEWWPGAPMQAGPFGAEVPVDAHILIPDLLLVPLAAFDTDGRRLGYGGGFYDRTLAALRAARPTRAVGFAYAAQQTDAVPTEATDQTLDLIVTETGLVRPGGIS